MQTPALYLSVLLCCTGAHAAAEEHSEEDGIPTRAFFETVRDYGFVFSPDGNHLAYLTIEDGIYHLAIINLSLVKIVGTHFLSTFPVQHIFWLNNNRLLYESLGEIRAINIDGTDNKTLINYAFAGDKANSVSDIRTWKVIGVIHGSEEILASSRDRDGYMHIHRINIYSGDKVDVINGNKLEIHEWFTDMQGQVRIGLRNLNGKIDLFSLATEDEKPVLVPLSLEKGKYRFTQEGQSLFEQRASIAGFAPNSNFLYLCENMHSDTFRLVGFDLAQDRIIRVIAEDRKYDICGPGVSMQPMFHGNATILAGLHYTRDRPYTLLLDDKFKAIQNSIDKKYENRINRIITWTADLDKVLFHSYNEKSNGRIYIYYPKEKRVALQSYYSLELEKFKAGSPAKTIEYKTRDNHVIEAYLTTPSNPEKSPPPLIVMPHANPLIRDTWGYHPIAQFFAYRGYAVLQPNYRGTIGYGRNHLQPESGEPVTLMTDDIADGVRDLIKRGAVDEKRIFIFGLSYGGYTAIMSTIRYPDLYRAAVSAFAPLDLVAQVNNHKKSKEHSAVDLWLHLAGKADLKEISPYHRIKEIKTPLFIFHGLKDSIVPVQQVYDFVNIKDQAPATIKNQIFKNEGHGLTAQNNNTFLLGKSLEHFRNSLEPAKAAATAQNPDNE